MEKVLLVINGRKPNQALINFACDFAAVTGSALTGLFIESVVMDYIPAGFMDLYPESGSGKDNEPAYTLTSGSASAISMFREECRQRGITDIVHIETGEPVSDVIDESRFADLLIMDPAISFYDHEGQLPSRFVKEVLSRAECPVLLAPDQFEHVDEIVFCYDSSPSSIFAIKQFTYLFPEFQSRKATLLEVNISGMEEFNESHRRMMDWLRTHYATVQYNCVDGDSRERLFTYFFMKRKKMIVMGAYGRTLLSNFFKKSSSDLLMRMVDLPLFITHH